MIQRILSEKQRELMKQQKKFKDIKEENLSDKDIKELVILIAKKLNIL